MQYAACFDESRIFARDCHLQKTLKLKNHDNQKIQNLTLPSTTDCGKKCNLVFFLSLYGMGEPLKINMRMQHKLYLRPFLTDFNSLFIFFSVSLLLV